MEQLQLNFKKSDITFRFTETANRYKDCLHELKEGEIWLGNTGIFIPSCYSNLKTIRLGEQAYDINGQPLNRNYIRPLILHKSEEEMYNKIYTDRMEEIANKYS